jgi:hypothetical protein
MRLLRRVICPEGFQGLENRVALLPRGKMQCWFVRKGNQAKSISLVQGCQAQHPRAVQHNAVFWELTPKKHGGTDVAQSHNFELSFRFEAPQHKGVFFTADLPVNQAPLIARAVCLVVMES